MITPLRQFDRKHRMDLSNTREDIETSTLLELFHMQINLHMSSICMWDTSLFILVCNFYCIRTKQLFIWRNWEKETTNSVKHGQGIKECNGSFYHNRNHSILKAFSNQLNFLLRSNRTSFDMFLGMRKNRFIMGILFWRHEANQSSKNDHLCFFPGHGR